MAIKNHELDGKIVASARQEFLCHGFREASMHAIAEGAGLTTGALYTRYKSKDDLFCSLVQEVIESAAEYGRTMQDEYMRAQQSRDPGEIIGVIHREMEMYQNLLFDHYDACTLFFCCSGGSSLETHLKEMMDSKAKSTVEYLKSISQSDIDLDGAGLLISEQFAFFRQILEKGYDRQKTIACMKCVEMYQEAGWKAIFEAIL